MVKLNLSINLNNYKKLLLKFKENLILNRFNNIKFNIINFIMKLIIIIMLLLLKMIKMILFMMTNFIICNLNPINTKNFLLILLMMNFNLFLNFIILIFLINLFMFMTKMIEDAPCILIILIKPEKLKQMVVIGICKVEFRLLNNVFEILLSVFFILSLNNSLKKIIVKS